MKRRSALKLSILLPFALAAALPLAARPNLTAEAPPSDDPLAAPFSVVPTPPEPATPNQGTPPPEDGGAPPDSGFDVAVDPPLIEAAVAAGGLPLTLPFQVSNLTADAALIELTVVGGDSAACTPRSAFVSCLFCNAIWRLDLETDEFELVVPSVSAPNNNFARSRDGRRLYYTSSTSFGSLRVVDVDTLDSGTVYPPPGGDRLQGPVGLALDRAEQTLYVSEFETGTVSALDLATSQLTPIATGLFGAQGLALGRHESRLYVAASDVWEIDLVTGSAAVLSSSVGDVYDVVLSPDGRRLYGADNALDRIVEIDLDDETTRVIATGIPGPDGLAVDPFDTTLFIGSTEEFALYRLDLSTGALELASSVLPATGILLDLPRGCDPEFLALGEYVEFLPGAGSAQLEATFEPLDLPDGSYAAEILVSGLFPQTDTLANVSAAMTVTGTPAIELQPSALDFGPTFVGDSVTRTLVVANPGSKRLEVTFASDDPAVAVEPAALAVEPGLDATLEVSWAPTMSGPFDAELRADSNASVLFVPLAGVGLDPPVLAFEPDSIDSLLSTDEGETRTLILRNDGGNPLEVSVVTAPGSRALGVDAPCEPAGLLALGNTDLLHHDLASGVTTTIAPWLGATFDLAITPDQTRAYVVDFDGALLDVTLTDGGVRTVRDRPKWLLGADLNENGDTLYAGEFYLRGALEIDTRDGQIRRRFPVPLARPGAVLVDDVAGELFVADIQASRLARVDLATGDAVSIPTTVRPTGFGLELSDDGATLYATAGPIGNSSLAAIDRVSGDAQIIRTGFTWARGLAVDGGTAWVADLNGAVWRIDLITGDAVQAADLGTFLDGLALVCDTFVDVEPQPIVLAPGEQIALDVGIDSSGLDEGLYGATMTLITNDPLRDSAAIPVGLEVLANQPPVAVCADVTVAGDDGCTADAAIDAGSFDPDGDPIELVQTPAGPYALGDTLVTLSVSDAVGAVASCEATVTVVDQTPPAIVATLDPTTLWPPNHRMIDVEVTIAAADNCGAPAIALLDVVSSEPDDGPGDGGTVDDVQGVAAGTDDRAFSLRAERSAHGPGRTYTATYVATDGSGNTASGTAAVFVPHDQGGSVDPLHVAIEPRAGGARIHWTTVSGADGYDVVRGDLDALRIDGRAIDLGSVHCVAGGIVATEADDLNLPQPGRAYFYLVQYVADSQASSLGTESAGLPREPAAGACP